MGSILRQKGEFLAQLQQHKAAESPALEKAVVKLCVCTEDWQRQAEATLASYLWCMAVFASVALS